MAPSLFEALQQVKDIRERLASRQLFRGYSGVARTANGVLALFTGCILASSGYPKNATAQFWGWGVLCFVTGTLNLAAVLFWFFRKSSYERNIRSLQPLLEPLAIVLVGGLFTIGLAKLAAYQLLFGVWMCLFGLLNISSRHWLPSQIAFVGCFYLMCGAVCLFEADQNSFLNPWPMALVFGIGEITGGWYFYRHRNDAAKE